MILATMLALAVVPDGGRLSAGTTCYAIVRETATGPTVIGATWQNVRASEAAGEPAWDIVVHQRVGDGAFDLRRGFLGRHGATLGQSADFIGHDGETHASFTRARGFDRGI